MAATDVIIKMPDTAEIEAKGLNIEKVALAFQIVDDQTRLEAGARFNEAAKIVKQIEKELEPSIDAANTTHKTLTQLRSRLTSPWLSVKRLYGEKLDARDRELERQRAKEFEEARAKAEKEAEAKRIADAQKAMDKGDDKRAEKLLFDPPPPITVPVTSITPPPQKIEGYSSRKEWDFEIEDLGAIPDDYKIADEVKIRKVVRASGSKTNIPGIRIFERSIAINR